MKEQSASWDQAAQNIQDGQVGVIPTDTLYGIVGAALDKEAVERIYKLKHRDPSKPFIILIGDITDLRIFHIEDTDIPRQYWPGPVSLLFPAGLEFAYLHRGTGEIALRLPDKPELRELLRKTGPIVAPSANPEGERPAMDIEEAEEYFGDTVDFYIDEGTLGNPPSRLIRVVNGEETILR